MQPLPVKVLEPFICPLYLTQGYEVNEVQNASLTATLFKRSEIVRIIGAADDFAARGRDLARRSWAALTGAKSFFKNVDGNLR